MIEHKSNNAIIQGEGQSKRKDIPQFPVKLPGSFWGVTAFFNPAGYKNKLENYRIFRANTKRQGLNLIAVELAFGNEPFELTDSDANILIQVRGTNDNIMWQKESLLNLGLRHLPEDCDKVAWIDADIIFKNDNWIKETSGLLEKYIVVQPFSTGVFLHQGESDLRQKDFETIPLGRHEGRRADGFAYEFITSGKIFGHEGLAWAIRREVIIKHFLYQRLLMGSADTLMAHLASGALTEDSWWAVNTLNEQMRSDCFQWARKVQKDVRESLGCTRGIVLHLWHGNMKERIYNFRYKLPIFFGFDPKRDVRVSSEGLLEWASDKPELRQAIQEYFKFRNEEGAGVLNSVLVEELYEISNRTPDLWRNINQFMAERERINAESPRADQELYLAQMQLKNLRQELDRTKVYLTWIKSLRAYSLAMALSKAYDRVLFHPHLRKPIIWIFDKIAALGSNKKSFNP